jgi:L-rhamnose isomerase/sugar isomerase
LEKLEDAAVVHRLTGAAPRVSLHIPWDVPDDPKAIRQAAAELGIGFDAVNSNTFQDQPGQAFSYKLGSFNHTDPAVRRQAVEHNLFAIESFDRVLACLQDVYSALPNGWRLFTEHKPYEPALYATVVQDWGSSYLLASALGDQAQCLVDLGHHLPNTNVELVVARLLGVGKLGGFHFNDSKYGDDDLTAGSIKPYGLFLIFHELVQAERERLPRFAPAYMIDQSHNIKDPLESLLQTVDQLQLAYAKARLVDQLALEGFQESGDPLMAERTLKEAYETDARPLVAEARRRNAGALDPVITFRNSGYRERKAAERPRASYVPPRSL